MIDKSKSIKLLIALSIVSVVGVANNDMVNARETAKINQKELSNHTLFLTQAEEALSEGEQANMLPEEWAQLRSH